MKYIITLLMFLVSANAFSQVEGCKLIIDGKEHSDGALVSKEVLLKFCTLQQRDTRRNEVLQPVSFEWVLSRKGEIFKGNMQDCQRLEDLIRKLNTEAILFIDKIKYKDVTGLCQGQFAFTIK